MESSPANIENGQVQPTEKRSSSSCCVRNCGLIFTLGLVLSISLGACYVAFFRADLLASVPGFLASCGFFKKAQMKVESLVPLPKNPIKEVRHCPDRKFITTILAPDFDSKSIKYFVDCSTEVVVGNKALPNGREFHLRNTIEDDFCAVLELRPVVRAVPCEGRKDDFPTEAAEFVSHWNATGRESADVLNARFSAWLLDEDLFRKPSV